MSSRRDGLVRRQFPRGGNGLGLRGRAIRPGSPVPVGTRTQSPKWYAILTRSRQEKKVRDKLIRAGIETFLPLFHRWSKWKGRRKPIELPLFAGYCFARFPLTDCVRVQKVDGVAGISGDSGCPEPIEDHEVDTVRRLLVSRFRLDPHPFVELGMPVEVSRGPLAGVRGTLVGKDGARRLLITVSLIRRSAVVAIHPADVTSV
jgi:transcription termination/antitermination protein NusG